jgi:hypothetical protein
MSFEQYEQKFKEFFIEIPNDKYIIELTKSCGYSKFVMLYKNLPLDMVYYLLKLEFGGTFGDLVLYIKDGDKNVFLPYNASMSLRQFIEKNSALMTPIYPNPLKVVYRIYYNNGYEEHTHNLDGCCKKNLLA